MGWLWTGPGARVRLAPRFWPEPLVAVTLCTRSGEGAWEQGVGCCLPLSSGTDHGGGHRQGAVRGGPQAGHGPGRTCRGPWGWAESRGELMRHLAEPGSVPMRHLAEPAEAPGGGQSPGVSSTLDTWFPHDWRVGPSWWFGAEGLQDGENFFRM